MENQNTCDLCGIEEKLYYCQCEKYFCRYHRHFILHQCPKIYSISYLHNHIINGNRCYVCTKKISTIFKSFGILKCYCHGQFCRKHRHFNNHRCTFDFKSYEKEKLKNIMPQIVADKVPNKI